MGESLRVDVEKRNGIQDYAGVLDVAIPQREKLGQLVRLRGGQVVDFARIGGEIVELPVAWAVWLGQVERFPVAPADGATTEQLPSGVCVGVVYRLGAAGQIWHQRPAAHGFDCAALVFGAGMRDAGEFQHGRSDVHHGAERGADLVLPVEARPGDEPDHPDAALGGERLVQA